MAALSSARQLFDRLVAGGSAAIEALVTEQAHEHESLDFKVSGHPEDNKTTWSEAVCGFANNQGGVLVWGIDARKDKATGIDAACAIKPVPVPAALRTRLLELLRDAVEPPVAGVEVRAYFQSGDSGPGFVICFVPESDNKPHRAELVKNKPYLIRIADAFVNPSPSLLRSLFFPRSSPRLWIDVEPSWQPTLIQANQALPKELPILCRVTLHNSGFVSAKEIFAAVTAEPENVAIETPFRTTKLESGRGMGIEHPRILHPSSTDYLCGLRFPARCGQQSSSTGSSTYPRDCTLKVVLTLNALDMQQIQIRLELSDSDIQARRAKEGHPVA